ILEHLGLLGLGERRIDLEAPELALAAERRAHQSAAGLALDLHLAEARLQLRHAGLHLLRLLHHLSEIFHGSPSLGSSASVSGSRDAASRPISRTASMRAPGKASSTARTNGCAAASWR